MKPWLPRQPARSGLTYERLPDAAAAPECALRIQQVMGEAGQVARLGPPSAVPAGFYRLDCEEKKARYFVKVVTRDQAERQARADKVARHVATDGLGASILAPGYPREFDGQHALLAYGFVDGRAPPPRREELQRLGEDVARLHASLATVPWAADVRREAVERCRMLARIQRVVSQGEATAGTDPARLRALMGEWPDAFSMENEACQVIHGDLNPGNLLLRDDGQLVFLDFEDSLVAWLPVRVDLALLIERLILVPVEADASAVELGRAFLSAYRASSGHSPFPEVGNLARTLRWLAMRSFCLLAEFAVRDAPWPDDEWNKFFWLCDMAERRRNAIAAIEAPFLLSRPAGVSAQA